MWRLYKNSGQSQWKSKPGQYKYRGLGRREPEKGPEDLVLSDMEGSEGLCASRSETWVGDGANLVVGDSKNICG